MSDKRRLYIVEDDADIRDLIIYAFINAGFDCVGFSDGQSFTEALVDGKAALPDIALLDIMLPGEDGVAVLKRVRAHKAARGVPIIMLTAKGSELDKVKGLDAGADDYVTKPFSVTELIARVNAVLRRCGAAGPADGVIEYKDITIDVKRREVTAGGEKAELTYTEFELLTYLAVNKGAVLTRDMIMNAVWGTDFFGESRVVDMHVKSLRKKLGVFGGLIKTSRGVGYKLY